MTLRCSAGASAPSPSSSCNPPHVLACHAHVKECQSTATSPHALPCDSERTQAREQPPLVHAAAAALARSAHSAHAPKRHALPASSHHASVTVLTVRDTQHERHRQTHNSSTGRMPARLQRQKTASSESGTSSACQAKAMFGVHPARERRAGFVQLLITAACGRACHMPRSAKTDRLTNKPCTSGSHGAHATRASYAGCRVRETAYPPLRQQWNESTRLARMQGANATQQGCCCAAARSNRPRVAMRKACAAVIPAPGWCEFRAAMHGAAA